MRISNVEEKATKISCKVPSFFMRLTGQIVMEVRMASKKNQTEFWNKVGVTQSAGSRYESGRAIPLPARALLAIIYKSKFEKFFGLK